MQQKKCCHYWHGQFDCDPVAKGNIQLHHRCQAAKVDQVGKVVEEVLEAVETNEAAHQVPLPEVVQEARADRNPTDTEWASVHETAVQPILVRVAKVQAEGKGRKVKKKRVLEEDLERARCH